MLPSSSVINKIPIKNRTNSASAEFHCMTALIIDPRHVRAKATIYHIQRLGIINVEVASNLNQGFVIISSGKHIDVVLI